MSTKFDTNTTALLWTASLEGWGEEHGSVTEGLGYHYVFIELKPGDVPNLMTSFPGEWRSMTSEEQELLGRAVGAIITEDDQGFVYGTLFESPEEFKQSCAETISTLSAQDEG